MLTEAKIEKNYQKLLTTNNTYGFLSESFLKEYGEAIKVGVSLETPYTFTGGTVLYALTVTKYAVMINGALPKAKQFDLGELIKMSIMSNLQMGVDEEGTFKEELMAQSLYRIISTGCTLNESEFSYMHSDFLTDTFAIGRVIKEAKQLAILEMALPTKSEGE